MKKYDIIKILMKKMLGTVLIFLVWGAFLPSFGIEEITLDESTDFKREITFEMPLDGPKKVLFGSTSVTEFSPVLNFQGVYSADIDEEKSNFTYPFILEGGGEVKFSEGKNKIRVISNFSKNVDALDNKFLGKLTDVYFEREIGGNFGNDPIDECRGRHGGKFSGGHGGHGNRFSGKHSVLVGNSRIPIGLEGGRGQYGLLFAKRAQIGTKFGNARAAGVRFRGDFGQIDYDLGGYSSTRHLQDISDGVEFAGRVGYKPFYNARNSGSFCDDGDDCGDNSNGGCGAEHLFKDLKLAASINSGTRDHNYTVSGASVEWQHKKFLMNAEYAYADGSNASKYSPLKQQGFYATTAYNLTDKIQAAFRYDNFDNNVKKSGDNVQKYTVGLNYYVIGQRLRFGVDYTYTQNGSAIKNLNSSAVHFITQVLI